MHLLAVICLTLITDHGYRLPSTMLNDSPRLPASTDLLCVLFEQAELEALIQLELADVPGLVEVLSGGVQFVQQLGDPWHQALCVGVTHPTAATAAAAAAAATAAVTVGEGLAALDSLEQPGDGFHVVF